MDQTSLDYPLSPADWADPDANPCSLQWVSEPAGLHQLNGESKAGRSRREVGGARLYDRERGEGGGNGGRVTLTMHWRLPWVPFDGHLAEQGTDDVVRRKG